MLATDANLSNPEGITTDAQGNLYIADGNSNRIRRVDKEGIISTLAGNGVYAYGGDGGPATEASLALPEGLAVDPQGNVYIADPVNYRIRKVVVPTTPLTVVSFSLMNAETNQEIKLLKAGEVVNLATLPTNKLNIRANTWPYVVGSVVLKLSGDQSRTQTENQSPYALFGDDDRNYRPWTPTVGSYSLTATAYSGAGATGGAGQPLTLAFSFVDQPTLMSFSLIDADTDEEIIQLRSTDELNLYWVGEQKFNIRANTGLSAVGSVVMQLSGPQNRRQTENQAPYALFGDAEGNYNPWLPKVGNYTLTGTIYSEPDGQGVAATPLTINLKVVNYHPESRLGTEGTAKVEELQIRSFPNPFTESFRLKVTGKRPRNLPVVIYDGYGRTVQQLENIQDDQLFSLGSGYTPGLYVVKVGEGKLARRFKMVKRP
ncbi:T9SS type A sorting domain-containing protein [Larkinella insperata]|uniref:T9SS type A sorting domain-containing protein n=1 Tax=Larkinella insperata TaxID=332158 RepID=A0ABW3QA04_9BACT|nr:T9SS type A sorting domain-containing protein [Larkinella insperata]